MSDVGPEGRALGVRMRCAGHIVKAVSDFPKKQEMVAAGVPSCP
jgi:hypothetical protein